MATTSRDAIRIGRERAERLRRKLLALGVLDRSLKPAQRGKYVIFPLKRVDEDVRRSVMEEGAELIR
ncbi:hypothetical protein DRN52_07610, partial [Thermococci archaeon]